MLTTRQRAVLAFIEEKIDEGAPPTVREICGQFGVTCNAVSGVLSRLEKQGKITRDGTTARNIRLVQKPGIPLLTLEDLRGVRP